MKTTLVLLSIVVLLVALPCVAQANQVCTTTCNNGRCTTYCYDTPPPIVHRPQCGINVEC
jgi:hypothetical protein